MAIDNKLVMYLITGFIVCSLWQYILVFIVTVVGFVFILISKLIAPSKKPFNSYGNQQNMQYRMNAVLAQQKINDHNAKVVQQQINAYNAEVDRRNYEIQRHKAQYDPDIDREIFNKESFRTNSKGKKSNQRSYGSY